jgi:hypothetical protein
MKMPPRRYRHKSTLRLYSLWNITTYSLVEVDRRFGDDYLLQYQGGGGSTEMSVYFNETTSRYIPESCDLHSRRRENQKSHQVNLFHRRLLVESLSKVAPLAFADSIPMLFSVRCSCRPAASENGVQNKQTLLSGKRYDA